MKKAVGLFLILFLITVLTGCLNEPDAIFPDITVDFLNTGKSDCTIIVDKEIVIIIDAADEDDFCMIDDFLQNRGITAIDYLILSHYDNDHIGSASELIQKYEVRSLWGPNYEKDSEKMTQLLETAEQRCIRLSSPQMIAEEAIPDGIIRWIPSLSGENPEEEDEIKENNRSLIVEVVLKGHSFLFLGDSMKARLEEVSSVLTEPCFVMKLPHHGNWYKALGVILKNTMPKAGVVCAKSGSTEKKLNETMDELGVLLYETGRGTVHVEWDTDKFEINQK